MLVTEGVLGRKKEYDDYNNDDSNCNPHSCPRSAGGLQLFDMCRELVAILRRQLVKSRMHLPAREAESREASSYILCFSGLDNHQAISVVADQRNWASRF